ncbi:MAG TPA: peptidase, partial [Lachnospiraceae bacterium]|nr:peptidase [Lachnospiraceae bacterium]
MFDIFMERVKRLITSRLFPIVLVYLLLFSVLINRIFVIQIVEGEEHAIDVEQKTTKERELKSTRGNILDRNGKLLAYNELSYSVILEDTGELETNEDKNSMIYKIIKIVEGNGGVLASDFFIQMNEDGSLSFKKGGSSELSFKRDVYSLSSVDDLTDEQKAATAQDIFNYLRHGDGSTTAMYDISDDYSMEEALKIMMIRFNIVMNKYSRYLPITIASNVNAATVASVKESSEELPGVQVLTESHRVYKDSEYFAHILGYTGLISQDKLEELQEDGNTDYSATDQIGITGIEKEYEEYLHGKNGSETVVVNDQTRVLDILSTDQPQAGNDVYLTIDADLQKACTDLLEKRIAGILLSSIKTNEITIFDVYYALINNSIIDISRFNENDATALEKSVYNAFEVEQKEVFKTLKNVLAINNTTSYKSLPEDMQEYIDYIYSMLGKEKILLTSNIDSEDEILKDYNNGKISFSEFLKYAISNNYIDLDKLDVGKEYFSTEELYDKLLTIIFTVLKEDSNFNKKIYKDLVYSYKLSGKEICLLLFDQSVLEYDEKEISGLEQGTVSPQSFIQKKIRDLKITPGQLALEPCSGSVVVTDIKTGDVLALVSYPGYDNNKFANRVDSDYFSKLNNDRA